MARDAQDLTDATRRGVRWTALGALGGVLFQVTQLVVLARILGPEEFGLAALIIVVIAIGTGFADLGFSAAIVQSKHVEDRQLSTLYSLNLVAGLGLCTGLWFIAPFIEHLVRIEGVGPLVRVASSAFLIAPWGMQSRALLQKQLEFDSLARIQLAALFLGTASSICMAFYGLGALSLVGGHLVTEFVRTAMYVAMSIRRHVWVGFGFDFARTRSLISFGAYRVLAMLLNGVTSRADQVIIGGIMGAAQLGLFNVAQRLAIEPVQKINPVVTRVAFPVFAIAQNDRARLQNGYARMIGMLFGVIAPLLVGLAATAHVLVPLLLGTRWLGTVAVVQLMAAYALLRCLGNAAGSLIIAMGRADWAFLWNLSLFIVVPVTIWVVAIQSGSLIGVSIALVLLYSMLMIGHYFWLMRRLIGHFGARYLESIFKPLGLATVMGILVLTTDTLLQGFVLPLRLAMLVMVGITVYGILSWYLQRNILLEIVRTLRNEASPKDHIGPTLT